MSRRTLATLVAAAAVSALAPAGASAATRNVLAGADGVARNVPDDRKRATVEFLRWYQTKAAQMVTAQSGGIPVSAAVYREPIAQERRFRRAINHVVNKFWPARLQPFQINRQRIVFAQTE